MVGFTFILLIVSTVAVLPTLEACPSCESFPYTGIFCPILTPMDDDNNVDVSMIPQICQYFADNGVSGLVVATAEGEGTALSNDDVKDLIDTMTGVTGDLNLALIVAIGDAPLPDLIELASYADQADVAALLCRPYRPNRLPTSPSESNETVEAKDTEESENTKDQVYYLELIADAAPNTPIFYEDSPQNTGVYVNIVELVEQAKKITNFMGAKSDFIENLLKINSKFNLTAENLIFFVGKVINLKPGLSLGYENYMISELNICPGKINDAVNYAQAGDYEKSNEIYESLLDLQQAIAQIAYNTLPILKRAAELVTGQIYGDVFDPTRKITDDQDDELQASLQDLGYEIVYMDSDQYGCIQC